MLYRQTEKLLLGAWKNEI